MKRFLFLVLSLALILACTMVLAEAADPGSVEGDSAALTQLLTKEVLATMSGMVLLTGILTQGIKMLLLRDASVAVTRGVAFVVAAMVTLMAKLIFSLPFEVADALILPGNALLVWWASMKAYEQIAGIPTTPAGNAEIKEVH